MDSGIGYDTALAHLLRTSFELGLHERDEAASRTQQLDRRRKDDGYAREGYVAHREIDRACVPHLGNGHDVRALEKGHARVVAQAPIELGPAHIDRQHARRPALQQAIREPSRRAPDIKAPETGRVDAEGIERPGELEAAAPDVGDSVLDVKLGVNRDLDRRGREPLPAIRDESRHAYAQGIVRVRTDALRNEFFIETTSFHGASFRSGSGGRSLRFRLIELLGLTRGEIEGIDHIDRLGPELDGLVE